MKNKLIILAIVLLSLEACYPAYRKMSKEQAEKTAKVYIEGEQYDNCQGYGRWILHNCMLECIYEELHCLGNGKGTYCIFARCPGEATDTLLFLELIVNPEYQKTPKKLKGQWALDRKYYPFIAAGRAYFAPGHYFRTAEPVIPVYIAPDTTLADRSQGMDERYVYNRFGFIEFWRYGEMYGHYQNGFRNGDWVFNYYTNQDSEACAIKKDYRRELIRYKMGKKDGPAKEYRLHGNNDSTNWDKQPVVEQLYENGKLIENK